MITAVLITGSNRGIGLAITKHGWKAFAAARDPQTASKLEYLEVEKIIQTEMTKQFKVNAVGPFLMTRAFLPNLKLAAAKSGSAKVAHVSSRIRSIACNDIGKGDSASFAGYILPL